MGVMNSDNCVKCEVTNLVAVCVAFVDERVVELDEHLLDVEPDQRVVAVLHRDLAGKPQQALEV